MAERRARSPYVWLRRLLLVVGLVMVAALTVMLAAYRFGRQDAAPEGESLPVEEGVPQQGKGFDYTQFTDGEPMFRIRAERSRQDREENAYLEGVLLDVYRDDGESYTITSEEAIFRVSDRSAELKGDVFLRAWGELELRARGLLLAAEGQSLTSEGAVELRLLPDLEGRASSLRVDRASDTLTLSEGVHLRSVSEAPEVLRLDCETLTYRREEGLVRAMGDVYLLRGTNELRARAVSVYSEDGFETFDTVRARFAVSGTFYPDGAATTSAAAEAAATTAAAPARRIDFSGDVLDLAPESEDAVERRVLLRGGDEVPARLRISGDADAVRDLTASELVGHLDAGGSLARLAGEGEPLTLVETRPAAGESDGAVTRRASAERALAIFLPDGRPGTVELQGAVEMREPRLALTGGERALIEVPTGRVTVTGEALHLVRERAQVVTPHLTYDRDSGVVRATGGVQAAMEEEGLGGLGETPFGRGEGPIRVTSDKATWTEEPPTVVFRDAVRAWRGQNLLLAEQLRADQRSREMAAAGGVKTVWLPDRLKGAEAVPIEVTAENLTYRDVAGELTYEGEVAVTQGRRVLTCRRLEVELTERGAAERMTCHEDVRLDDPVSGREVFGDRALYTLDGGLVEVFGDSVRMRDATGNELEGRYLRYDVESGSAQLRSRAPGEPPPPATAPAETPAAESGG